jgi:hypothetical protein
VAPLSHPEAATVLDGFGQPNIAVVYTGVDHLIYEKHQVGGGSSWSGWSSETYSGLMAYSAVAVIGGTDPNQGFQSEDMLLVALDQNQQAYALLSNGAGTISGWMPAPSMTLWGAPSGYVDQANDYWVVGVDAASHSAFEVFFNPATPGFQGSWNQEPGTPAFDAGASASFAQDPYDMFPLVSPGADYLVHLTGTVSNAPVMDSVDWTNGRGTTSTLAGLFDSGPSAGNSLGCSAGGCGYQPILTIHGQDGNCYWHDATNLSGEWSILGHP